MFFRTKEKVDGELALYEKRRKLEIDEQLSEWRRSQKNRAVEEVLSHTEEVRMNSEKIFGAERDAKATHVVETTKRTAELAILDEKKAAKTREIEQAQKDFEARGLLRDRAQKAEKEMHDAIVAEKDKHIAHLTKSLESAVKASDGLLGKLADALGVASAKESTTKVIGFGPSSQDKSA